MIITKYGHLFAINNKGYRHEKKNKTKKNVETLKWCRGRKYKIFITKKKKKSTPSKFKKKKM